MHRLKKLTYRIFGKIYKKNIIELKITTREIFPPKGFVQIDRGFVTPKEFDEKCDLFENYKEDYLGYPIYYFRYKRGIKIKTAEMIEADKRAIESLFEEATVEEPITPVQ